MRLWPVVVPLLALVSCGRPRTADFRLPELATGHAEVRYQWTPREGGEIRRGNPGAWDAAGVGFPSVVRHGGISYQFYSGFDGRIWRTGLATSPDGLGWNKQGVVLAPDPARGEDGTIAANGTALVHKDEFYYWYQAGPAAAPRLGLARSSDGRSWRKEPFPILDYGPAGDWDESGVSCPYVIEERQYFYLFYRGHDRAGKQCLGLARSHDGIKWERLKDNPILKPGGSGEFDEAGIGKAAVWIGHGSYGMIYTGIDRSRLQSLGMARSLDGIHWNKLGKLAAGADPAIELLQGRLAAWFGDGAFHDRIGVALLPAIPVENR